MFEITTIATFVGFVWLASTFFKIGKWILSLTQPSINLKSYGKWAVITGCTDGIGRATAQEFAKRGMNLILISRSEEKLKQTREELLNLKATIEIKTIALDFTARPREEILSILSDVCKNDDIGVLVNNVGIAYDHAQYFDKLDIKKINDLIDVNVWATTAFCHAVLPGMLRNRKGVIINVSSASALVNEPLYAVYSGTKAYLNSFSDALYSEYGPKGIIVQSQIPGLVATKLSKIRHASLLAPNSATYARASVNQIGKQGGLNIPFWSHALLFGLMDLIPRPILAHQLLQRGLSILKLANAKKQQQQKEKN